MKSLNNKGMTLIELLISFTIASAIVVSMFSVIMSYQTEQATEAIKSEIISYKNTITKMIQTDIIKGELKSVKLSPIEKRSQYTEYKFKLKFNKTVDFSGNNKSIFEKDLLIRVSDSGDNYIIYTDVNSEGNTQPVKYLLPNNGQGSTTSKDNNTKTNTNLTKFSAVSTNLEEDTKLIDDLNLGVQYFDLDITISNNELGGDYHVKIVVPLNYPYCK